MNGAPIDLIREYHERFHPNQRDMTPDTATPDLLDFRYQLFAEETREALEAWEDTIHAAVSVDERQVRDTAHLLHELADVAIVAYGTAMQLGVDLDEVMRTVMAANMAKHPNPDPAGKAIKPYGYVPADAAVLAIVAAVDGRQA